MEHTSRVLVAGATGALGRPLVRRLVERGMEVAGLTRHASRTQLLRDLGAEPVVADALDAAAVTAAVVAARPDAVVHALTAIPKRGPLRAGDLDRTNPLRRAGTANLLAAATLAGALRFVADSMVFVDGFGDHGEQPLTEERTGFSDDGKPWLAEAVASVRLRRRLLPVPAAGAGVGSWIHIEDAAAAVVAPLLMADLESRILVTNAKAKRELQWSPQFPTYREGLANVAERLARGRETGIVTALRRDRRGAGS